MKESAGPNYLNWFERWMLNHLIGKFVRLRQLTFLFAEIRRISKYYWYEDTDVQIEDVIRQQFESDKANVLDGDTGRYLR